MISKSKVPTWPTEMVKLSDEVYAYIQAKGTMGVSNAGLIAGEKHAAIVDTLSTVSMTEAFLKEVRNVTNKSIKYLINTHCHGDHCWGNHLLPEAVSISHNHCRKEMIQRGQPDPKKWAVLDPEKDFTGACYTLTDVTFDHALTIHLDSREIHLLYYGYAHSEGDILVYLPEERIAFCGDFLFLYSTPAGQRAFFAGWIEALNKIAELDVRIYVPGHGPPCDREGLIKCREYLMLIYNESRRTYEAGVPPREAAIGMPLGEFKQWAEPERILGNVDRLYQEFRGVESTSPLPVNFEVNLKAMKELAKSDW